MLLLVLLTSWAILWAIWIRIRNAPYVSLLLAAVSLLFTVMNLINASFDQIGRSFTLFSIGMTLAAAGLWWLCLQVIGRRSPFAGVRWLVWWARPLLAAIYSLIGLSFAIMLVSAAYPNNWIGMLVNSLLLAGLSIWIYQRQQRVVWLVVAFGMMWLAWIFGLNVLGMKGVQWHTIPLAILLLALAQISRLRGSVQLLDGFGVAILMIGSLAGIRAEGVLSPTGIGMAVQLVLLISYGYLFGRRIPFFVGLLILGSALVIALVKVNFWLVLLFSGIGLLGGALLMEVQRNTVEGWLNRWKVRWQDWQ